MSNNLNCAAMGYDCVFSITAENGEEDFLINVVEQHAEARHPELTDEGHLKPDVRDKLRHLLDQAHYSHD